jgi:16S rRNA (uracil1498-N3)-methyltransferase
MHRFFVSPNALHGSRVVLPETVAHQLRQVLRMRPGAHIVVLDNQGWEYEIELTEVREKLAAGEIVEKRPASGEPGTRITLYQCVLKKDNFEWVLQKCTEIGVTEFVPVVSQRTVVNDLKSIAKHKHTRWGRIVTEAAEQSRRGALPELAEPVLLPQALSEINGFNLAMIPWEGEQTRSLREALSPLRDGSSSSPEVAIFIGPEGGFTDEEITLARQYGIVPVTLGARILRAETAAMSAALLTLHELGDTSRPPEA